MRVFVCLSITCLIVLLSGCGGPRQEAVPYSTANRMRDPMTVRVIESWDLITHSTRVDNPSITHLVEVEVILGPSNVEGKVITLPYDDYATGRPPPAAGSEVVMMPAAWLAARGAAMGRPGLR